MKTSTKQKLKATAAMITIATLSGCVTGPDALTGTVLGGVAGAATGGIIGHQKGKGLEGAAIGGGIGAIAGNLLGSASDQRNYNPQMRNQGYQPQYYQQQPPQPRYYQQPQYYQQQQPRYYQQSYQNQPQQYDVYRSRTVIITRDNDDCNQYNSNYNNRYNNQRSNPYYDDYAYGAPPSRDARSNGGLYNASGRNYNNNNTFW